MLAFEFKKQKIIPISDFHLPSPPNSLGFGWVLCTLVTYVKSHDISNHKTDCELTTLNISSKRAGVFAAINLCVYNPLLPKKHRL